jgi:4-carboxymuconolactone decarboxylase
MNLFTAMVATFSLLASASAHAQTITIARSGSRPSQPAPAENFTGSVRVETLFEAIDPSHANGASVTFEPGARTAWHAHPRGQVLIVTAGTGRVQRWGDPIEEIRQGDVVRIPPGQKHWHGASPDTSMTHIAIQEHLDGTRVRWMERVSDEQYKAFPSPSRGASRAGAEPSRAQSLLGDFAPSWLN